MRSALYYPHTEVRNEDLVRTALLTWDKLEYICPSKDYVPQYNNKDMADAMEIIGSPRAPTDDEQNEVHALIEELIGDGVPEIFKYAPRDGIQNYDYEMWPGKLAPKTWELLGDRQMIGHRLGNYDYPASQTVGLSLMAMLADVMAGDTRARVTDRAEAYAAIANAPNAKLRGSEKTVLVIPLTFKAADLTRVSTRALIEFRKKETDAGGNEYRALRHNYLKKIEDHVGQLTKVTKKADREELDRSFEIGMEDDFKELKSELQIAKAEAFFTKDVVTLVTWTGATALGTAIFGSVPMPEVVGIGGMAICLAGVMGSTTKLAKSRREILRKHPMAYVYELGASAKRLHR